MARLSQPYLLSEAAGFESWRLVVVEAQPKAARVVFNDQRWRIAVVQKRRVSACFDGFVYLWLHRAAAAMAVRALF